MELIEMDGLCVTSDDMSLSVKVCEGRVTVREEEAGCGVDSLRADGYRDVASFARARLHEPGDDPQQDGIAVEDGILITNNGHDYLLLHM